MDIFITTLTLIAFASSLYFILTWGWAIGRASRRQPVSLLGVLDFAGLQLMVLLFTGLALVSIAVNGVQPTDDWNLLLRRTVLYTILTLITLLRTFRWIRTRRPRWARPLIGWYDTSRARAREARRRKDAGLAS